jgi:hypothetical protein
MTNTMSASFAESDFRVGRVISRSLSVLSRHFVTLFIIAVAAYLPTFLVSLWMPKLMSTGRVEPGQTAQVAVYGMLFLVVFIVFNVLSQAMIVHAAFQHMRRRPVHLVASVKVGLRRILSLLGLAIVLALLVLLAFVGIIGMTALINPFLLFLAPVPFLIILTVYFVTTPVSVVEERGPFASMGRSMQLTKGHRWKIFGLWLLLIAALLIASILIGLLDVALRAVGGPVLAAIIGWIWNGVWVAYYAVTVAVAYHDLRVAKEGIDIEQIASVFD